MIVACLQISDICGADLQTSSHLTLTQTSPLAPFLFSPRDFTSFSLLPSKSLRRGIIRPLPAVLVWKRKVSRSPYDQVEGNGHAIAAAYTNSKKRDEQRNEGLLDPRGFPGLVPAKSATNRSEDR